MNKRKKSKTRKFFEGVGDFFVAIFEFIGELFVAIIKGLD